MSAGHLPCEAVTGPALHAPSATSAHTQSVECAAPHGHRGRPCKLLWKLQRLLLPPLLLLLPLLLMMLSCRQTKPTKQQQQGRAHLGYTLALLAAGNAQPELLQVETPRLQQQQQQPPHREGQVVGLPSGAAPQLHGVLWAGLQQQLLLCCATRRICGCLPWTVKTNSSTPWHSSSTSKMRMCCDAAPVQHPAERRLVQRQRTHHCQGMQLQPREMLQ